MKLDCPNCRKISDITPSDLVDRGEDQTIMCPECGYSMKLKNDRKISHKRIMEEAHNPPE